MTTDLQWRARILRGDELYSPKIRPEHLARKAIVYLRQSSERQVRQNIESQRLQYEVQPDQAVRIGNLTELSQFAGFEKAKGFGMSEAY
jgi:hypothetical protein